MFSADGTFLGVIGLEPAGTAAAVGYVLCRHAWGRGYATEATQQVVDLAFAHFGLWRVWATCALPNLASRPDPRDSHCLAIMRDDWLAEHAARHADRGSA